MQLYAFPLGNHHIAHIFLDSLRQPLVAYVCHRMLTPRSRQGVGTRAVQHAG